MAERLQEIGSYRIERRFRPEPEGGYKWVVYERYETGAKLDASGRATAPGLHPQHQTATSHAHVWMPLYVGSEEQAHAKFSELING